MSIHWGVWSSPTVPRGPQSTLYTYTNLRGLLPRTNADFTSDCVGITPGPAPGRLLLPTALSYF